jgi:hypothetical protein
VASVALVFASGFANLALAHPRCERPDPGFATFLARFRSDRDFQISRVKIPLRYNERGPGAASTTWLSTRDVKARWKGGLLQALSSRQSEYDEAAVCEEKPRVAGRDATLVQYSCHSDLFANTFRFVARTGCWFLGEVTSAGG